jgi:transcriptional regulator with AAA-type ATPase domain
MRNPPARLQCSRDLSAVRMESTLLIRLVPEASISEIRQRQQERSLLVHLFFLREIFFLSQQVRDRDERTF